MAKRGKRCLNDPYFCSFHEYFYYTYLKFTFNKIDSILYNKNKTHIYTFIIYTKSENVNIVTSRDPILLPMWIFAYVWEREKKRVCESVL